VALPYWFYSTLYLFYFSKYETVVCGTEWLNTQFMMANALVIGIITLPFALALPYWIITMPCWCKRLHASRKKAIEASKKTKPAF
jgi:hypothetical protein